MQKNIFTLFMYASATDPTNGKQMPNIEFATEWDP